MHHNYCNFLKIQNNLSGRYIVNADTGINVTVPWVPIGTEEKPFTGYIDFNNRNIILSKGYDTNYINDASKSDSINIGLFGVSFIDFFIFLPLPNSPYIFHY
mgnify:CR=1 FL=1